MGKYQESKDRYLKEKVEDIKLRVPVGYKDVIKTVAKQQGKSVNKFILDLIESEINSNLGE